MRDEALTYAQSHQSEALEDLKTFLRIPSVSTLPEHQPDMQRAAQWLADKFTTLGLQHIAIMPTAGHPVVYADWLHAGVQAPTLLIYGHYDVQPADPLEEWSTPPFEPTVRDDKLYARGADDNKGQHYSHLAAVEAYLKTSGRLPLNVKFLIEGEEEIGSPNLRAFIKEQHELLKADVAVISDTGMIDAQHARHCDGVARLGVYGNYVTRLGARFTFGRVWRGGGKSLERDGENVGRVT